MRKSHVWAAVPVLVIGSALAGAGAASAEDRILKSYETTLRGESEVPGPGDEDGRGKYFATTSGDQLCYTFRVVRIKGQATAAHIHVGASDVAGPVAVTLLNPNRAGVSECLTAVPDDEDTAVTMSESELAGIKANPEGWYVNVHNAQYPAGAVRGQLTKNSGG